MPFHRLMFKLSRRQGLYPTVVLVLVHQEKSLEETLFTTIPETASRHGHASQTVELRHMSSTTSLYVRPSLHRSPVS